MQGFLDSLDAIGLVEHDMGAIAGDEGAKTLPVAKMMPLPGSAANTRFASSSRKDRQPDIGKQHIEIIVLHDRQRLLALAASRTR